MMQSERGVRPEGPPSSAMPLGMQLRKEPLLVAVACCHGLPRVSGLTLGRTGIRVAQRGEMSFESTSS